MKLKLSYTHKNLTKPILSQAILKTGASINILEARVTAATGEMIIDAQVPENRLKELLSLLHDEGLIVKELTETLEIDREKCISCGACVSPCPTGAIRQDQNWDIEFDDKKCIRCRICVNACPVRAIRIIA